MSSTNGKIIENEAYPTPAIVVDALLSELVIREGDRFLEPCKGDGAIYDKVNATHKQWAEIKLGVDYLATDFKQQDIIITNPPFSLTCEFLTKSLNELSPDGTLAYLQRVNFLGTKLRVPFWAEVGFPNKTPVIVPRPRFVKKSSDSCEYCWFIYDRGNRFPTIPNGLSHIISKTLKTSKVA